MAERWIEEIRKNPTRNLKILLLQERCSRNSIKGAIGQDLRHRSFRKYYVKYPASYHMEARVKKCKYMLWWHEKNFNDEILFTVEKIFVVDKIINKSCDMTYGTCSKDSRKNFKKVIRGHLPTPMTV